MKKFCVSDLCSVQSSAWWRWTLQVLMSPSVFSTLLFHVKPDLGVYFYFRHIFSPVLHRGAKSHNHLSTRTQFRWKMTLIWAKQHSLLWTGCEIRVISFIVSLISDALGVGFYFTWIENWKLKENTKPARSPAGGTYSLSSGVCWGNEARKKWAVREEGGEGAEGSGWKWKWAASSTDTPHLTSFSQQLRSHPAESSLHTNLE